MVDLPGKRGVFFHRYVSLPEGEPLNPPINVPLIKSHQCSNIVMLVKSHEYPVKFNIPKHHQRCSMARSSACKNKGSEIRPATPSRLVGLAFSGRWKSCLEKAQEDGTLWKTTFQYTHYMKKKTTKKQQQTQKKLGKVWKSMENPAKR